MTQAQLSPLPIRPRPAAGESVSSYVRRLAIANHLRPSYLHGYLAGPPSYLHGIKPERLAAVSGRTVAVLDRTLTGLARQPRRQPSRSVTRDADKPGLFAAIRRDGQDGHSIRALAARHQVHRRTIRQALADPAPPPRRQMPLRRHALDRLHEPIAAMLALAPTGPRPAARRYTDEDIQRSHAARRAKDAAIRGDAGNGMSGRAIERKHHVGRRTIVKALASADPPERKKIHREPTALDGLHWHIDAMIAANPQITIAAIWERLAYEHGTAVAYPTLRTYVASGRGQGQTGRDQLR